MDKIMVDIRGESIQLRRIFNEKDFVSVEDLISKIEELDDEVSNKESEYKELENNLIDNYKPKSPYELYDVNERDFY